uniref:Uncharacterized protein n=1 Tax=Anguilla anguilla TaxID=7936 RepID=A0A0E9RYJ5_ANGAN
MPAELSPSVPVAVRSGSIHWSLESLCRSDSVSVTLRLSQSMSVVIRLSQAVSAALRLSQCL